MKETEFLSDTKIRHFRIIEDYNMLMSMPNATQKTVFNTILNRNAMFYKNYDSIKQTFARLMKIHPEKFNQQTKENAVN